MAEIIVIPDKGLVTVATFAKIVGVAEGAVERTIERGDTKALKFQKGSSKWLISLSAINDYLRAQNDD